MTLEEFEKLCLEGPLGSITPQNGLDAVKKVGELIMAYQDRLNAANRPWESQKRQPWPKPERFPRPPHASFEGKVFGIEASQPSSDKA